MTNQDNDPEPDPPDDPVQPRMPQQPDMAQRGEGGGGCALAMGKRMRNTPENTMLNLFLIAVFLFSAILWRSPLKEK